MRVVWQRAIVPLWLFRGSKLFSRRYFVGSKYFLVGISWVQIIFSWVFLGPKYFLVGISWVQIIFSWVFRGSKMFPCRYFVSPKIFLVGISCARNFFSRVQNFPSWAISWFSVVDRMRKSGTEIHLKLRILFQIDFNSLYSTIYIYIFQLFILKMYWNF